MTHCATKIYHDQGLAIELRVIVQVIVVRLMLILRWDIPAYSL
jgi:hypothetical protein